METITVTDWRGNDKQVTGEEYVKQWMDHASEMIHLVDYKDEDTRTQYDEIMSKVDDLARHRFDNILNDERNKNEV